MESYTNHEEVIAHLFPFNEFCEQCDFGQLLILEAKIGREYEVVDKKTQGNFSLERVKLRHMLECVHGHIDSMTNHYQIRDGKSSMRARS